MKGPTKEEKVESASKKHEEAVKRSEEERASKYLRRTGGKNSNG